MILNQIDNARLGTDRVDKIYLGQNLVWTNGNGPDYASMYLTIEALEDGDFYVRNANVSYSVNGGAWETTTGETALSLNQGDTVRFKGTTGGRGCFSNNSGLTFNAYGNVESLTHGDNFYNVSTAGDYTTLFIRSNVISANNLILPATTLTYSCYASMFGSCTGLTTAPELPATTLADICYQGMFDSCISLASAPELPATTLAESCYLNMFAYCFNLTEAPELPATTLVNGCYNGMFRSCGNINYIKCLATNISASGCLDNWVADGSPTGTFVKAAGVNWPTGTSGIPSGWTVEDAS